MFKKKKRYPFNQEVEEDSSDNSDTTKDEHVIMAAVYASPEMMEKMSRKRYKVIDPRVCPNCGQETNGNKYCTNCGTKLKED